MLLSIHYSLLATTGLYSLSLLLRVINYNLNGYKISILEVPSSKRKILYICSAIIMFIF